MTTLDPLDAAEAANIPGPSNPARRAMIDSQLRTSGVNAPFVLKRMGQVAREDFVPAGARSTAYVDRAIALGEGKWLAAPLVQGMMLAEADPAGTESAIVVDGGSGYLAELLRPLVGTLTVLAPEEALCAEGETGDADLLVIDGAVEHVPESLLAHLKPDARIVTGLAENGVTRLAVGRKTGSRAALFPVHDIGIPRLSAFDKPKGWSF